MKLGSLFDGIGGFPLAAVRNKIIPVWASEIEPFPMAVTRLHFPQMQHVGDITMLHGENLPVVDIVAGGSPCQDLSIAGTRTGLAGERSGLFLEQVRLVREMRKQDGRRQKKNKYDRRERQSQCTGKSNGNGENESNQNGPGIQISRSPIIDRNDGSSSSDRIRRGQTNIAVRPRYLVWENVPGAFSSGKQRGGDFHLVLEEIGRIAEDTLALPRPPGGVWTPAGLIMGEGFSIAWRVLDAQFWGVPQRRRRIFLVADFAGHSAGEILFESDRVWRHYQAVQEERKNSAQDFGTGPAASSGTSGIDLLTHHIDEPSMPGTETARLVSRHNRESKDISAICLMDQGGERMDTYNDRTGTLLADGRSNPPIIMPVGIPNDLPIVMATGQSGAEIAARICPTLTAAHEQPILFDNHGKDNRYSGPVEVAQTITAALGSGGNNAPLAVDASAETYCIAGNIINRKDQNGGNGCGFQQRVSYTLTTEDRHCIVEPQRIGDKTGKDDTENTDRKKKTVRKLLPLECERLMGYPDGWTNLPGAGDSKKYRALGNSVAVPCVDYILCGIAYFLSQKSDGSGS